MGERIANGTNSLKERGRESMVSDDDTIRWKRKNKNRSIRESIRDSTRKRKREKERWEHNNKGKRRVHFRGASPLLPPFSERFRETDAWHR